MIPPFDENGNLPPGIHWAEWLEFQERFGTNATRLRLLQGLQTAMEQLKAAGCRTKEGEGEGEGEGREEGRG